MWVTDSTRVLHDRPFNVFYHREPGRWRWKLHTHRNVVDLTFVQSGMLSETINGTRYRFPAGSLLWIREQDQHDLRGRDLTMYNINFAPAELARLSGVVYCQKRYEQLLGRSGAVHTVVPRDARPNMGASLRNLFLRQTGPDGSLLFQRFLFNLFIDHLLPLTTADRAPAQPAWLAECVQYIDERLERDLTPAAIPEHCGRSREHVSRTFRRFFDVSLSGYVNRRKMERAGVLLSNTSRPILDICYSLGYSNPSYFYRLFRDHFGTSPKAYRMQRSSLSGESVEQDR